MRPLIKLQISELTLYIKNWILQPIRLSSHINIKEVTQNLPSSPKLTGGAWAVTFSRLFPYFGGRDGNEIGPIFIAFSPIIDFLAFLPNQSWWWSRKIIFYQLDGLTRQYLMRFFPSFLPLCIEASIRSWLSLSERQKKSIKCFL